MSSRGKNKKRKNVLDERQVVMVVGYYKRHLDVMLERELDIKLTKWQRFLLKQVQKGIK